jgi:hypothetical protein
MSYRHQALSWAVLGSLARAQVGSRPVNLRPAASIANAGASRVAANPLPH